LICFFRWFHGAVTLKQARSLLENQPVGTFLVRYNESVRGGWIISYVYEDTSTSTSSSTPTEELNGYELGTKGGGRASISSETGTLESGTIKHVRVYYDKNQPNLGFQLLFPAKPKAILEAEMVASGKACDPSAQSPLSASAPSVTVPATGEPQVVNKRYTLTGTTSNSRYVWSSRTTSIVQLVHLLLDEKFPAREFLNICFPCPGSRYAAIFRETEPGEVASDSGIGGSVLVRWLNSMSSMEDMKREYLEKVRKREEEDDAREQKKLRDKMRQNGSAENDSEGSQLKRDTSTQGSRITEDTSRRSEAESTSDSDSDSDSATDSSVAAKPNGHTGKDAKSKPKPLPTKEKEDGFARAAQPSSFTPRDGAQLGKQTQEGGLKVSVVDIELEKGKPKKGKEKEKEKGEGKKEKKNKPGKSKIVDSPERKRENKAQKEVGEASPQKGRKKKPGKSKIVDSPGKKDRKKKGDNNNGADGVAEAEADQPAKKGTRLQRSSNFGDGELKDVKDGKKKKHKEEKDAAEDTKGETASKIKKKGGKIKGKNQDSATAGGEHEEKEHTPSKIRKRGGSTAKADRVERSFEKRDIEKDPKKRKDKDKDKEKDKDKGKEKEDDEDQEGGESGHAEEDTPSKIKKRLAAIMDHLHKDKGDNKEKDKEEGGGTKIRGSKGEKHKDKDKEKEKDKGKDRGKDADSDESHGKGRGKKEKEKEVKKGGSLVVSAPARMKGSKIGSKIKGKGKDRIDNGFATSDGLPVVAEDHAEPGKDKTKDKDKDKGKGKQSKMSKRFHRMSASLGAKRDK
jgi:hypothetical protein